MSVSSSLRVVLLVILVLLVQSTIGLNLRVAGAHLELVWLLPIAAGLAAGPEEGAVVGFVSGMALDLFLPTPFGLTALVGCLLGYAAGRYALWTSSSDGEVSLTASVLAAVTGSAAAVMLYAVLGAVLGQEQMLKVDLVAVVAVVAVANAVLVAPADRLMRWALGPASSGRRRQNVGASW